MATVNVTMTRTVTLTLSEDEARWLKGALQNPLGTTPDEEDPKDGAIRRTLFTSLHAGLEHVPSAFNGEG